MYDTGIARIGVNDIQATQDTREISMRFFVAVPT